ncbi:MAG: type II toxin-antitoxin system YafQ family toxin [Rhodospirillales bacterium]
MRPIRATARFERDLKLARKRGKNLGKIWRVISALQRGEKPEPRHRAHRLTGDWGDFWECHIEPDWLLIWDDPADALVLVRTGTHADLFG